jgi:PAS domain S-box-containing protein
MYSEARQAARSSLPAVGVWSVVGAAAGAYVALFGIGQLAGTYPALDGEIGRRLCIGAAVATIVACALVFGAAWTLRDAGWKELAAAGASLLVAVLVFLQLLGVVGGLLDAAGPAPLAALAARVGVATAVLAAVAVDPRYGSRAKTRRAALGIALAAGAGFVLVVPASFGLAAASPGAPLVAAFVIGVLALVSIGVVLRSRHEAAAQRRLLAAALITGISALCFLSRQPSLDLLGSLLQAAAIYLVCLGLVIGRLEPQQQLVDRMTAQIAELEAHWRNALEVGHHGVYEWDVPKDRWQVSARHLQMLGYSEGDALSTSGHWTALLHPDDRERALAARAELLTSPAGTKELEYRLRAKDGSYRWVLARAAVTARDADGKAIRVVGTATDVTARHEMEEQLRRANADLQAQSARERIGIEEERLRIARSLHDEFGQYLAALGMEVHGLRERVAQQRSADDIIARMFDLLARARTAMRAILADLRPEALDLGLAAACERLVRQWGAQTGIDVDFVADGPLQRVPAPVQAEFYRVLQESLNNVAKHAQATSVHVSLLASDHDVSLSVADDGVGMPREARYKRGHYGLFGIEERVARIDGMLRIDSAPGRGTELTVVAPLPPGPA